MDFLTLGVLAWSSPHIETREVRFSYISVQAFFTLHCERRSTSGSSTSGPSRRCLLCWGLAPCVSCSQCCAAPRPFIPCLSQEGFGNIFCPHRASTMMGSTGACRPLFNQGIITLVFYPQWHCLLGLPSLFWTPFSIYHLRLGRQGFRRIWIALEGFYHLWD